MNKNRHTVVLRFTFYTYGYYFRMEEKRTGSGVKTEEGMSRNMIIK